MKMMDTEALWRTCKQDIKIINEETLDAYELTAYKAKSVTDNDPSVKKIKIWPLHPIT